MDTGVKLQDYMVMQTQEDVAFGHGIRSYAKSGMVKDISHDLLKTMVEANPHDPRAALFVHTAGGAVKRVGELDTAFPHRNAETMLVLAGGWLEAEDDAPGIQAIRDWYYELDPYTGGYYTNIEYDGEGANSNYGPAYPRLQQIKTQYDPGNLFRLNSNIEPA